ncbi:DNA recombination and repair protein RecO [Enterobacter cloacae]|uniref:DNA recombination and repair protein RecO n=1 Tax=Enterobacter cloacae TaxID=550 RepID=A0A377LV76_ENTCL|nr:DNA recombination and repair protein RecO [Enterobacter cloacae]
MEGWQRAFVLHSRPWSETSLMLDVFTEESGRVRLVAKGARSKRSNLKGALQPFTPLLVRFGGRGKSKPCAALKPSLWRFPFLASRFTAVCTSMNSSHAFLNMRLASLNFSSIICTVSRPLLAQPVRLNPPCAVSSWRCWVTWDMASIFCIVREWRRGRRRDDLPVSGRKRVYRQRRD